jgi:hypothetical protein
MVGSLVLDFISVVLLVFLLGGNRMKVVYRNFIRLSWEKVYKESLQGRKEEKCLLPIFSTSMASVITLHICDIIAEILIKRILSLL